MQIENNGEPYPRQIRLLNVEEAIEFIAEKIATGEPIVLDLFGGETSQNPGANKFRTCWRRKRAERKLPNWELFFQPIAQTRLSILGPRSPFLEAATIILKPGGLIDINANFANPYRFGTSGGKEAT